MNRKFALIGIAVLLMSNSGAWAGEHDTTIRLMGPANAELPDAVMKEISLPDALLALDSVVVDKALLGLETANDPTFRRDAGLSKAEAARDRTAELVDGAAENRENNGRSGDRPDPPPDRPDPPGPPGGV